MASVVVFVVTTREACAAEVPKSKNADAAAAAAAAAEAELEVRCPLR